MYHVQYWTPTAEKAVVLVSDSQRAYVEGYAHAVCELCPVVWDVEIVETETRDIRPGEPFVSRVRLPARPRP